MTVESLPAIHQATCCHLKRETGVAYHLATASPPTHRAPGLPAKPAWEADVHSMRSCSPKGFCGWLW